MSDLQKLISIGKKLAEHVSELLAISTPCPEWDKKQGGWRHQIEKDGLPIFLLIKLTGATSTVNAMLTLCSLGYWFQAAILARSIHEANLSIAFMFPKPGAKPGNWPSKKQTAALNEFFKETWVDPARPFKETSQRSQILLRELAAALGHLSSKSSDISKHDAGQSAFQMMRFLSDYTHMAYPCLMELLEAERGYVLCGQQKEISPFNAEIAAEVLHDCCTCAYSVSRLISLFMSKACKIAETKNDQKALERLQSKMATLQRLQVCLDGLSNEPDCNSNYSQVELQKLLREFKG